MIKDVIANTFLQQLLTRPAENDVMAIIYFNDDYGSGGKKPDVNGVF